MILLLINGKSDCKPLTRVVHRFDLAECKLVGKSMKFNTFEELLLFKMLSEDERSSAERLRATRLFARHRFLAVADWLVRNQATDSAGEWKIMSDHVFTQRISLQPGWCSAMGQGKCTTI